MGRIEAHGHVDEAARDSFGCVEFFLLDDLVNSERSTVRFFAPFDDFKTGSVPKDLETYKRFMSASIEFVEARNQRIDVWARNL